MDLDVDKISIWYISTKTTLLPALAFQLTAQEHIGIFLYLQVFETSEFTDKAFRLNNFVTNRLHFLKTWKNKIKPWSRRFKSSFLRILFLSPFFLFLFMKFCRIIFWHAMFSRIIDRRSCRLSMEAIQRRMIISLPNYNNYSNVRPGHFRITRQPRY